MNKQKSSLAFKSLFTRLLFSLCALLLYRFGTYITLPGINSDVLQSIIKHHQSNSFLGLLNVFSGGALGRMTIFALNVMPYIVSSIILQLLSTIIPSLNHLKQEGRYGIKKINFYTRCMTVVFCIIQALFIVLSLQNMNLSTSVIINPDKTFFFIAVITLLGGTIFLVWLGEQITVYGIGNGISLIIFAGIISELPGSINSFFIVAKTTYISIFNIIFIFLLIFGLLWLIVIIELSCRKISIQYPRKQIGNKLYGQNLSYIPLKINISGIIPPIFANALLILPITIANFFPYSIISSFILLYFSPGKILYIFLYTILITFFCFFYVGLIFNIEDTAYNLKKNGGFIIGKRPGRDTAKYLSYVINRLSVIGAAYLSCICLVPELIRNIYLIPFAVSGTSLLIIVNVIMDIFSQIQNYLFTQHYGQLSNKFRLGCS